METRQTFAARIARIETRRAAEIARKDDGEAIAELRRVFGRA